jgi:hypothetical protein
MSATSFSGGGSELKNLDPTKLSSGTADISISGNAATVTNGIYTTGNYADPPWITSLSPAKITSGTANISISGNAATATTATTANSVVAGGVATTGLADGAVTSSKLAVNAVTPGAIAFYQNVAIVAPSGGDYNNPATAMAAYSLWCGPPSATNPCLLKIMPGVYDIGTSTVVMQPYIDIEGSGEKLTKITGAIVSGSWPPTAATVKGANNAQIRFLTVQNTGVGNYVVAVLGSSMSSLLHVTATVLGPSSGSSYGYGVYNLGSQPTMTNVTVTVSGAGSSYGYGVYNYASSATMSNVTVYASATHSYGVYNSNCSPIMTNVTVTALGGYAVYNEVGVTVKINNSVLKGASGGLSIYNDSGVTTLVAMTQLDGGAVNNSGGTLTCVGAYNGNYVALGTNCQ